MHQVAVLALDNVVPYDLSIPCEVFGRAQSSDDTPAYNVSVCGPSPSINAGVFEMRIAHGLDVVAAADTVVLPGINDTNFPVSQPVLDAVMAAWERGARITSICTGVFILAQTGLLNGKRATTHWLGTAALAERYPSITVEPDVLFVDEGRIITSAGSSAGLDMCLHLVRRDHGQAVAAHSARLAVAPLNRDGGQAQFIRHEPPKSRANLAPILEWALENLDRRIDVDALAARAGMSSRTFARRFREQTGTTPLQWLITARVRRAQEMLETTSAPIDEIALAAGFESPVTFRARFQQSAGITPAVYRRRFNVTSTGWQGQRRREMMMADAITV